MTHYISNSLNKQQMTQKIKSTTIAKWVLIFYFYFPNKKSIKKRNRNKIYLNLCVQRLEISFYNNENSIHKQNQSPKFSLYHHGIKSHHCLFLHNFNFTIPKFQISTMDQSWLLAFHP